ncbi:autoinducer binding domain-containing protein [Corticibacterium sp. UT-5YL-CI-8]|nr:autoinducer binding domain-containing protein [Tianweitania sp. UT-5YL-CI-8]
MFADDAVSKWSMQKTVLFCWREAQQRSAHMEWAARIENEAAELGLRDGIAFPMQTSQGWRTVILLATENQLDLSKKGRVRALHGLDLFPDVGCGHDSSETESFVAERARARYPAPVHGWKDCLGNILHIEHC